MIPKEITPDVILGIIHRRKWIIFILLLLAIMCGLFLAVATPRIYKAETLILVTPPRVPSNVVRPVVSGLLEERLHSISQQIMSRSRLEKVIKDLGLYKDVLQKFPMDIVIENMRKKIEINTQGGRRSINSFSISFTHSDPKTCADVVNRIASLFIAENLKVREERAVGTTSFLEREQARLKKKLEKQEKAINAYKAKHFGELPEQLQTNVATLQRLQSDLQTLEASLSAAKQRKILMMQQASSQPIVQIMNDNQGNLFSPDSGDSENLDKLKKMLEDMRLRYTEKHPDVVRLKRKIKKVEKELAEQEKQADSAQDTGNVPDTSGNLMQAELMSVNAEITNLEKEKEKLKKAIELYQKRINNTYKVEERLADIKRDYDITHESYQSLLKRKIEAKVSENMEKRQKGEQFTVIDPAIPPEVPYSPNINMILFLSLLLGLGSGAGLAVGLEYLDPTFHDKRLLEKTFSIPVIALIPRMYTRKEKRKKFITRFVYVGIFLTLIISYSAFLLYLKKHNLYLDIGLPSVFK